MPFLGPSPSAFRGKNPERNVASFVPRSYTVYVILKKDKSQTKVDEEMKDKIRDLNRLIAGGLQQYLE